MTSDDLIAVLGAGASVDAGLPTAADLNDRLLEKLSASIPGFADLYRRLLFLDHRVEGNYERLFYWLLETIQTPRLYELLLTTVQSGSSIVSEAHRLIPHLVSEQVTTGLEDPAYLNRLADLPPNGRLKVFTLNYDLAVETACKNADIPLTCGFDPWDGRWRPELLNDPSPGISLYKLHSSVDWWEGSDYLRPPDDPRAEIDLARIVFRDTPAWRGTFSPWVTERSRCLVLGPGDKVQSDDPFFYMVNEFHRAIEKAKLCITIGYGWQDKHITDRINRARQNGMNILDVNLVDAPLSFGDKRRGEMPGRGLSGFERYQRLEWNGPLKAGTALGTGYLQEKVREILG